MKSPAKSPATLLIPGRALTFANVAEGAEGRCGAFAYGAGSGGRSGSNGGQASCGRLEQARDVLVAGAEFQGLLRVRIRPRIIALIEQNPPAQGV